MECTCNQVEANQLIHVPHFHRVQYTALGESQSWRDEQLLLQMPHDPTKLHIVLSFHKRIPDSIRVDPVQTKVHDGNHFSDSFASPLEAENTAWQMHLPLHAPIAMLQVITRVIRNAFLPLLAV